MQNESWQVVAKYLYGENKWLEGLGIEQSAFDSATNNQTDDDSSTSTDASTEEETELVGIEDYVSNFIVAEGGNAHIQIAISFLKPIVSNNIVQAENEAKDAVSSIEDDYILETILDILLDRLPESKRKRPPSSTTGKQNELKKWLKMPNEMRNFMFYKTELLKEMVNSRGIKIKGSKTIDKMIEGLANGPSSIDNSSPSAQISNFLPTEQAI